MINFSYVLINTFKNFWCASWVFSVYSKTQPSKYFMKHKVPRNFNYVCEKSKQQILSYQEAGSLSGIQNLQKN